MKKARSKNGFYFFVQKETAGVSTCGKKDLK